MAYRKIIFSLLLIASALSTPAVAQFGLAPGLTPVPTSQEKPVGPPTVPDQSAAIKAQIDEIQQGLAASPPAEEARLLEQLMLVLKERQRWLDEIEKLRGSASNPEETALTLEFSGSGPFSILRVDALRDEGEAVHGRIQGLQLRLQGLELDAARYLDAKRRLEESVRKMTDSEPRLQKGSDGAVELEKKLRLRLRISDASLALVANEREKTELELAAEKKRAAVLDRSIERVRPSQFFSLEELERIRDSLKANQEKLADEIARIKTQNARRQRERARWAAGAAPEKNSRLRLLDAELETDRQALQFLPGLETLERVSTELWGARHAAMNETDPQRKENAIARLKKVYLALDNSRQMPQELESARAAVREQTLRLDNIAETDPRHKTEQALLLTLQARVNFMERVDLATFRMRSQLTRWLGDLNVLDGQRGFSDLADQLKAWSVLIWNYELFTVEDATEVDGRKVSVSHGITVRKSVGAVLLFVVGYWLFALLSRRMHGMLVRRFGVSENVARVARRWLMIAFSFVLLIIVLNLARIPLTVFAFLGGALALGMAFGTQNIIKNFISGVIILFERKIRVGDIVQLAQITGQVTAVDLRASTVRGFDGVEALVPNSMLLENQVVNWTYSNSQIRRIVKVGIAYGSDPRAAAAILIDCVRAHPNILSEPTPEILFEDFGDNALQFSIYYWVELSSTVSGLRIDSDLRYALYAALEQAGIAIPFPQRDVHIDTSRPLRVELQATGSPLAK